MRCIKLTLETLKQLDEIERKHQDPLYLDEVFKRAEEYIAIKQFTKISELVFRLINKN